MSRAVVMTGRARLGLFMSVAIDLVIVFGEYYYGKVEIGSTMGLAAFLLMLVVEPSMLATRRARSSAWASSTTTS